MASKVKSLLEHVKHPINSIIRHEPETSQNQPDKAAQEQAAAERQYHDKKEREYRKEFEKSQREEKFEEEYNKDPARERYGYVAHIGEVSPRERIVDIENHGGDTINFRARIHSIRPMGAKLAFIVLRQESQTVQGVIRATDEEGAVSELMVRWAAKLSPESLVLVEGKIRKAEQEVRSAEVHNLELDILRLYLLSEATDTPPWTVADMSKPVDANDEDSHKYGGPHFGRVGDISLRSRLANRTMDLRAPSNQAIFRLRALFCRYARNFLEENGFVEIHTPKLQEGASEGGASIFKVDYFQRAAFLAQSPQLAKEMCISADFERVYEIGPVFRAENSNTHRHMTEFIGLDLEMAIEHSYLEARNMIDNLLKFIFRNILGKHRDQLDRVKELFPHDDIVFPDETVVINFRDGIKMLKESGWEESEGEEIDEYEDLSRRAEIRLGELVKEKYNTDYYILDQFPLEVRPFYTMVNSEDSKLSNSFDIFLRGEEILSGGQRLHSTEELLTRLDEAGIDPASMMDYVNAFKWGMPPHAGGGIGLERLCMLFLKLSDVRNATLFHRDPKSFANAPLVSDVKATMVELPHVEKVVGFDELSILSDDSMKLEIHPELTDLIAKYGDSTNTAWTDPGYVVWRYQKTGAAIGYISSHGHSVTWGNPLCPAEEYPEVIKAYVNWVTEQGFKPIWLNINAQTEEVLAKEFGWRALSATAEQRIRPLDPVTYQNKNVQRKVRAAKAAGMTIQMITREISEQYRCEIDERIKAWQNNREGTQVHTTMIRPWADCKHRSYFIGRDKDGKPCGLLTLHKLAPENGYQIKWALSFPNSPPGTSEYLLDHAMTVMRTSGVSVATFGSGAKDHIDVVDNIKGIEAKLLSQVYNKIVSLFPLMNKSRYREKFGAYEDDLFISYPTLGFKGISAIMHSVKDPQRKKEGKESASVHTNGARHDNSGPSSVLSDDSTCAKLKEVRKEGI